MLNTNHTHSTHFNRNEQPLTTATGSALPRWLRLVGIVLLSLLVLVISWLLITNLFLTGLLAGETAPLFRGTTLAGEAIDLAAYRGQPVMLTFWSPECFACREELPAIQALSVDPNNAMQLVTVVSHIPAAEVRKFVAEAGLTFPIIVDEAGTIAKSYAVSGIPFTYFIGPHGLIDQAVIGAGNAGALESTLSTWLHSCQIDEVCEVK